MRLNTPKKIELNERRQRVAEMYVQGQTQAAIATEIGVSQATVFNDLTFIQDHWRASALRDFDAARELELQKLDKIEREAWTAWDRSKQPAQSAKVRSGRTGEEATEKSLQHRVGDPRYLDQVLRCIAARRALLGLDAPTRIAPVMPDGKEPYRLAVAHLSVDELKALKNVRDRALARAEDEENEEDVIDAESLPAPDSAG
jgi:hypothetical protein